MKHHYVICRGDLILRPINIDDLESIRVWRNRVDIRKWFVRDQLISQEEQEKWFLEYLKEADDMMFAAEWQKQFIGTAALYNISKKNQIATFGRLMIGEKNVRGLGLGKKIVKAVCMFGFKELHLKKIELEVFVDNIQAISVYEQIGFIKEVLIESDDKKLYKMSLSR